MQLTRGSGARTGGELLVQAPGEGGIAIVSLATDLPATRYRGLAWDVTDLPSGAQVRVLWFSDTDPGRINSLPAIVEAGRVRPVIVGGAPGWTGRIRGLGLTVAGALPRPVRITAVAAKPMGAVELLSDRAAEWLAFEVWNGTSINVVVGGADVQDLPLPAVVGVAAGIAILLLLLVHRLRPDAAASHRHRRRCGVPRRLAAARPALERQPRAAGCADDEHVRRQERSRPAPGRRRRRALRLHRPGARRAAAFAAAGLGRLRRAVLQRSCGLSPVPAQRALPAARSHDAGSEASSGPATGCWCSTGAASSSTPATRRCAGTAGAELPAELKLPGNAAALFRFK